MPEKAPLPAGIKQPQSSNFQELLTLLGRLNYVWTNTESVLIHVMGGLAGTDKDTATIIFLTLNTTRARLNLVERLAKHEKQPDDVRDRVLAITKRLSQTLTTRNRFNHCIYAFDTSDGSAKAIQMRVQDSAKAIRYGKAQNVDTKTLRSVAASIEEVGRINDDLWALVQREGYPV